MKAQVNHIALNVKDFDWYVSFFETVCDMTIKRQKGDSPNRQLWFNEGIQLNEKDNNIQNGERYDHIGLFTEHVSEVVEAAVKLGCRQPPGKPHWIEMPEGILLEFKGV
ncbi:MAG: VOC family protein [Lachnospiraceae bacterium]